MLISNAHQFLFIHVPKAAGSSIERALAPWSDSCDENMTSRVARNIGIVSWWGVNRIARGFPGHSWGSEVQARLPAEMFARLFKFAFVWNPWDRLVSSYYFLLKRTDHRRHEVVRSLRSFDEYVDYEINREIDLQTDYVCDARGGILLDFVGRYERLSHHFAQVCRRLKLDVTLPHINESKSSPRPHWRDHYSAASQRKFVRYFRDDLERLGYSFDADAPAEPLLGAAMPSAAVVASLRRAA